MPARITKVWQRPGPYRTVRSGKVAATFRACPERIEGLRYSRKIVINPSDGGKCRLRPATTVTYNIKSLNFRLKAIL
ncbi:MAG: hypothetical protein ACE5GU_11880 [Candidatus Scalinduaceae bacterium]